jgi:hypothetical protein
MINLEKVARTSWIIVQMSGKAMKKFQVAAIVAAAITLTAAGVHDFAVSKMNKNKNKK